MTEEEAMEFIKVFLEKVHSGLCCLSFILSAQTDYAIHSPGSSLENMTRNSFA